MQIAIHAQAGLPGAHDDIATVSGDTITHNGTTYDLSSVPEGGEATPQGDHPFAGPITRTGGVLHVPLHMRYDASTAERRQPTAPAHWTVTVTDGSVPDLVVRKEDAE